MIKRVVFAVILIFTFSLTSFGSNLIEGKLKNGLTYRIYKKSDLPIVSVNVKVKAGSVFDEKNKFGEAYVVGNALENCDSPKYKAKKLRFLFDKYGVESSVSVGKGYITITATALNKNIVPLFCLLHEILNSRFNQKGIDYVKRNTINAIKSLKNDKDYLAIHSAFVSLIKENTYSHTSLGTVQDVKNISRNDVVSFFDKYFNASNMVISISGGFSEADIKKYIKYYFSSFKKGEKVEFPKIDFNSGLHIRDVVKPDTEQSYIYFAFPGFEYGTREYFASKLLAFTLGGNLNSYLTKDIRTRHGYAYSVFSFVYRLPEKSVFVVGLQTQNKFTLSAINEVFKDIKSINAYATNENLKLSKDYMEGSLPIALQTPQSIANALSDGYFLNIKGLPWEFDLEQMKKVSLKDLKQAAESIFSNTVSIGIVSYKDFTKSIESIAKKYGYR